MPLRRIVRAVLPVLCPFARQSDCSHFETPRRDPETNKGETELSRYAQQRRRRALFSSFDSSDDILRAKMACVLRPLVREARVGEWSHALFPSLSMKPIDRLGSTTTVASRVPATRHEDGQSQSEHGVAAEHGEASPRRQRIVPVL
jgi:hypothetical protein